MKKSKKRSEKIKNALKGLCSAHMATSMTVRKVITVLVGHDYELKLNLISIFQAAAAVATERESFSSATKKLVILPTISTKTESQTIIPPADWVSPPWNFLATNRRAR